MYLYAGGAVVARTRGLSGEHQLWELCTPHYAGIDGDGHTSSHCFIVLCSFFISSIDNAFIKMAAVWWLYYIIWHHDNCDVL